MVFRITVSNPIPKLKENMAAVQTRFFRAIEATANMLASMIEGDLKGEIAASGKFGSRWTDGLKMNVEGAVPRMRLVMSYNGPAYADVFAEGATIQGKPLLWIPFSNSDAAGVRISEYPGGVTFKRASQGGKPLAFSIADKLPKYFGTESVTIPKLWRLNETAQQTAMENFRSVFEEAWQASE